MRTLAAWMICQRLSGVEFLAKFYWKKSTSTSRFDLFKWNSGIVIRKYLLICEYKKIILEIEIGDSTDVRSLVKL